MNLTSIRSTSSTAGIVQAALEDMAEHAQQVGEIFRSSLKSQDLFEQMVASAERAEEKLRNLEAALDTVEANHKESERLAAEYLERKRKRNAPKVLNPPDR